MTGAERRGHVVFLNRFYRPDVSATAQMLTDLAEGLVARGWRVSVVTSRARYGGGGSPLPREAEIEDVRILRVGGTGSGEGGLFGRLGAYGGYAVRAFFRALAVERPDVIVALTDPPLLVAPALLVGRLRGVPVVSWSHDLYPAVAAELGVLRKDGIAHRILRTLGRSVSRRCDLTVAIGERMRERLVRDDRVDDGRVRVIPNWVDCEAVRPVPHGENPFRVRHGLGDRFVVLYSGNAGRAHTFDGVLEAAGRLRRDAPDVLFLFVGGGARRQELERRAEEGGLPNVRFCGYVPRPELSISLSAADVGLVTEDPRVTGLLVPSKAYGVLASGRPLIFVGSEESDIASIVRDHRCGLVVSPGDDVGLAEAVRRLRSDGELREEMGRRGRRIAVEHFDVSVAVDRWSDELAGLVSGARDGEL